MWRKGVDVERRTKTPEQALTTLMAMCARAERSSGDARRLMTRWGVAEQDQEGVLQRLIDDRFIDDRRYAAAFVRDKRTFNGWGGISYLWSCCAKVFRVILLRMNCRDWMTSR